MFSRSRQFVHLIESPSQSTAKMSACLDGEALGTDLLIQNINNPSSDSETSAFEYKLLTDEIPNSGDRPRDIIVVVSEVGYKRKRANFLQTLNLEIDGVPSTAACTAISDMENVRRCAYEYTIPDGDLEETRTVKLTNGQDLGTFSTFPPFPGPTVNGFINTIYDDTVTVLSSLPTGRTATSKAQLPVNKYFFAAVTNPTPARVGQAIEVVIGAHALPSTNTIVTSLQIVVGFNSSKVQLQNGFESAFTKTKMRTESILNAEYQFTIEAKTGEQVTHEHVRDGRYVNLLKVRFDSIGIGQTPEVADTSISVRVIDVTPTAMWMTFNPEDILASISQTGPYGSIFSSPMGLSTLHLYIREYTPSPVASVLDNANTNNIHDARLFHPNANVPQSLVYKAFLFDTLGSSSSLSITTCGTNINSDVVATISGSECAVAYTLSASHDIGEDKDGTLTVTTSINGLVETHNRTFKVVSRSVELYTNDISLRRTFDTDETCESRYQKGQVLAMMRLSETLYADVTALVVLEASGNVSLLNGDRFTGLSPGTGLINVTQRAGASLTAVPNMTITVSDELLPFPDIHTDIVTSLTVNSNGFGVEAKHEFNTPRLVYGGADTPGSSGQMYVQLTYGTDAEAVKERATSFSMTTQSPVDHFIVDSVQQRVSLGVNPPIQCNEDVIDVGINKCGSIFVNTTGTVFIGELQGWGGFTVSTTQSVLTPLNSMADRLGIGTADKVTIQTFATFAGGSETPYPDVTFNVTEGSDCVENATSAYLATNGVTLKSTLANETLLYTSCVTTGITVSVQPEGFSSQSKTVFLKIRRALQSYHRIKYTDVGTYSIRSPQDPLYIHKYPCSNTYERYSTQTVVTYKDDDTSEETVSSAEVTRVPGGPGQMTYYATGYDDYDRHDWNDMIFHHSTALVSDDIPDYTRFDLTIAQPTDGITLVGVPGTVLDTSLRLIYTKQSTTFNLHPLTSTSYGVDANAAITLSSDDPISLDVQSHDQVILRENAADVQIMQELNCSSLYANATATVHINLQPPSHDVDLEIQNVGQSPALLLDESTHRFKIEVFVRSQYLYAMTVRLQVPKRYFLTPGTDKAAFDVASLETYAEALQVSPSPDDYNNGNNMHRYKTENPDYNELEFYLELGNADTSQKPFTSDVRMKVFDVTITANTTVPMDPNHQMNVYYKLQNFDSGSYVVPSTNEFRYTAGGSDQFVLSVAATNPFVPLRTSSNRRSLQRSTKLPRAQRQLAHRSTEMHCDLSKESNDSKTSVYNVEGRCIGDVNGDNQINGMDRTAILNIYANYHRFEQSNFKPESGTQRLTQYNPTLDRRGNGMENLNVDDVNHHFNFQDRKKPYLDDPTSMIRCPTSRYGLDIRFKFHKYDMNIQTVSPEIDNDKHRVFAQVVVVSKSKDNIQNLNSSTTLNSRSVYNASILVEPAYNMSDGGETFVVELVYNGSSYTYDSEITFEVMAPSSHTYYMAVVMEYDVVTPDSYANKVTQYLSSTFTADPVEIPYYPLIGYRSSMIQDPIVCEPIAGSVVPPAAPPPAQPPFPRYPDGDPGLLCNAFPLYEVDVSVYKTRQTAIAKSNSYWDNQLKMGDVTQDPASKALRKINNSVWETFVHWRQEPRPKDAVFGAKTYAAATRPKFYFYQYLQAWADLTQVFRRREVNDNLDDVKYDDEFASFLAVNGYLEEFCARREPNFVDLPDSLSLTPEQVSDSFYTICAYGSRYRHSVTHNGAEDAHTVNCMDICNRETVSHMTWCNSSIVRHIYYLNSANPDLLNHMQCEYRKSGDCSVWSHTTDYQPCELNFLRMVGSFRQNFNVSLSVPCMDSNVCGNSTTATFHPWSRCDKGDGFVDEHDMTCFDIIQSNIDFGEYNKERDLIDPENTVFQLNVRPPTFHDMSKLLLTIGDYMNRSNDELMASNELMSFRRMSTPTFDSCADLRSNNFNESTVIDSNWNISYNSTNWIRRLDQEGLPFPGVQIAEDGEYVPRRRAFSRDPLKCDDLDDCCRCTGNHDGKRYVAEPLALMQWFQSLYQTTECADMKHPDPLLWNCPEDYVARDGLCRRLAYEKRLSVTKCFYKPYSSPPPPPSLTPSYPPVPTHQIIGPDQEDDMEGRCSFSNECDGALHMYVSRNYRSPKTGLFEACDRHVDEFYTIDVKRMLTSIDVDVVNSDSCDQSSTIAYVEITDRLIDFLFGTEFTKNSICSNDWDLIVMLPFHSARTYRSLPSYRWAETNKKSSLSIIDNYLSTKSSVRVPSLAQMRCHAFRSGTRVSYRNFGMYGDNFVNFLSSFPKAFANVSVRHIFETSILVRDRTSARKGITVKGSEPFTYVSDTAQRKILNLPANAIPDSCNNQLQNKLTCTFTTEQTSRRSVCSSDPFDYCSLMTSVAPFEAAQVASNTRHGRSLSGFPPTVRPVCDTDTGYQSYVDRTLSVRQCCPGDSMIILSVKYNNSYTFSRFKSYLLPRNVGSDRTCCEYCSELQDCVGYFSFSDGDCFLDIGRVPFESYTTLDIEGALLRVQLNKRLDVEYIKMGISRNYMSPSTPPSPVHPHPQTPPASPSPLPDDDRSSSHVVLIVVLSTLLSCASCAILVLCVRQRYRLKNQRVPLDTNDTNPRGSTTRKAGSSREALSVDIRESRHTTPTSRNARSQGNSVNNAALQRARQSNSQRRRKAENEEDKRKKTSDRSFFTIKI